MRRIGWIAIFASAFALAGSVLGPGCDAEAGPSAVAGAVIGAFVGATGFRGAGALLGLLIGVNVGTYTAGEFGYLIGLVVGATAGWYSGAALTRILFSRPDPKPEVPSPQSR